MKARKPSGQILIIFETDLSQAKSFDEEKLTPYRKQFTTNYRKTKRNRLNKDMVRYIEILTPIPKFARSIWIATKHRNCPIILRDQL